MMKKRVLNAITQMRIAGKKAAEIADALGLSVNTVKSHIRRHPEIPNTLCCQNCGIPVPQTEGRKMKKFCCDRCRIDWWNHQYRDRKRGEAGGMCG
jgi:predicted transcriptional regulator